jgi:branched-chain amino acid transport system permease protein
MAINIMLSVSLNLVNGFCGQFSLGHAGFMAVGAYVSALFSLHAPLFADPVLGMPAYVLTGGLCAAAAGFMVGMPSLRLRGDYLAIVTLGFGEIIRVILLNMEIAGGARGLYGIPGTTDFKACVHAYLWAGATVLLVWRLVHSSYGRSLMSVREDEIAAECMGINTTRTKVMAFVISSFFAGAAGGLFAGTTNSLNPASFQFVKSVDVVIMVVLGGMGSITGSVLGAIVVTVLPEALRPLRELTGVDLRMVVYSLTLILLMILRPEGLLGNREWTWFWRKRAT